jgi:hypothetical protein
LTPAATRNVIDGEPPEIVHATRMWVSPANGPATDAYCEPIAVNAFDVSRVVADEKPPLSSVWIVNVIVGVDVPDGGEPMHANEYVCLRDEASGKSALGKFDKASGFITRSLLCVPMEFRGELVGVVEVLNKNSGGYTQEHIGLLSSLASFVRINSISWSRISRFRFVGSFFRPSRSSGFRSA